MSSEKEQETQEDSVVRSFGTMLYPVLDSIIPPDPNDQKRRKFYAEDEDTWTVARDTFRSGVSAIVTGKSTDSFALTGSRLWPQGDDPIDRDQRLRTTWDMIGANPAWSALADTIRSSLSAEQDDSRLYLAENDLFRGIWERNIEQPITELIREREKVDTAGRGSFVSRYWKPALSLAGLAAGTYVLCKTFGGDDGG